MDATTMAGIQISLKLNSSKSAMVIAGTQTSDIKNIVKAGKAV